MLSFYLGPQDLRLAEQVPADIALDADYMTESLRRIALAGLPGAGALKEFDDQIVNGAENPVLSCLSCRMSRLFSRLSSKIASSARAVATHLNN